MVRGQLVDRRSVGDGYLRHVAVDAEHLARRMVLMPHRGCRVELVSMAHGALPIRIGAYRRLASQIARLLIMRIVTRGAGERALLVAAAQEVAGGLIGREELGAVGPKPGRR